MAIKVNNTTVIDDSRNLVNINGLKTIGGQSILGSGNIVAGAGAAADVFYENAQTLSANYTITSGKNAGSFGPVSVADGFSVTIPDGSIWTIV